MDNARLLIYNSNWEQVGIIDIYTSLIWTKRYTSCGDFELYLPFKKRYLNILSLNNFVCIENAETAVGKYAMIIEHIEITQSSESAVMMLVKGRSLLSILYRRVLYSDVIMSATKFEFICKLINDCFNSLPPRKWGGGLDESYALYDLTADKDSRVRAAEKDANLGEVIEEFCDSKGIGMDILYDGQVYRIYVYKYESRENDVFFSGELDNLVNCTYVEDISDFANVARISNNEHYVTAPNGEDGKSAKHSSLDRYEKSLASDLVGDGDDTYAALQSSGLRQLRKYSTDKKITAEIISTKTFSYGDDYRVGDVVKIITDFGLTAAAQIIEMTESWSVEGYSLIPTFANYKILEQEDK